MKTNKQEFQSQLFYSGGADKVLQRLPNKSLQNILKNKEEIEK